MSQVLLAAQDEQFTDDALDENPQEEDPILILDIKLVKDKPEKITIYEKDVPEEIVEKFCKEHRKYFISISQLCLIL
jgi:hypothetical protein